MNVIKRIQRLTGETGEPRRPDRRSEMDALRMRMERILARRPQRTALPVKPSRREMRSLQDVIPGREAATPHGSCFVTEGLADHSFRHGDRPIEALSGLDMNTASVLTNDRFLKDHPLTDGLFLDTETTGLAGGSGTMTFLIGLGWFEKGGFATRQIFIRDFAEERAALSILKTLVENKRFLVTFNGKSFDVGLLSTRFIMNRLPNPLTGMPHLDLLYPARRLIGHRLENCRLITLEEQVLGFFRQGDVPGSEIPQRYFDWLRRRDARLVADVFEHNRMDVISLASLMVYLTEMIDVPIERTHADLRDALAVARLLIERQDVPKARRLLESLAGSGQGTAAREARRLLSLLHKRAGRWEDAAGLWKEMIREDGGDMFALIEMAKWHEHRICDFERALDLVRHALHCATDMTAFEKNALVHRLRRLEKRLHPGKKEDCAPFD
jgi:uncharacterized protein YprB with RNaseH-like and TPR domain